MPRIKRGVTTRAKHKRILENAKGYYGRRKNTIRIARQAVEKAGQYAYRDRKVKKRSFRALWIQRINAAVRAEGLTYGQFIHALKLANIDLDRKVLADIAMHEAEAFSAIIAQAKAALPFWTAFFRGVLCNVLVCMAVWMTLAGRSVTDKVLAVVFPISAFVAAGFEHSVANMYFFPLAMMLQASAGAAVDFSWLWRNLVPVIAGNLVGGSVLVALVYYVIYHRPARGLG